jgi:hypothetical protein
MRQVWTFLLHLSSGELKVGGRVSELRQEARALVKHYPLGGDLEAAARRYAQEPPIPPAGREVRRQKSRRPSRVAGTRDRPKHQDAP